MLIYSVFLPLCFLCLESCWVGSPFPNAEESAWRQNRGRIHNSPYFHVILSPQPCFHTPWAPPCSDLKLPSSRWGCVLSDGSSLLVMAAGGRGWGTCLQVTVEGGVGLKVGPGSQNSHTQGTCWHVGCRAKCSSPQLCYFYLGFTLSSLSTVVPKP